MQRDINCIILWKQPYFPPVANILDHKLLSLKINTTDFFLRRFSNTPKKRRVPCPVLHSRMVCQEGCKGSSGGTGLALPPSPPSQAPPHSGTNTHPAGIPSILTTRPHLPKNTKHSLPCPGSSLHRNQNPIPPQSPQSFALSLFPSQLCLPKAISAHSRHLCPHSLPSTPNCRRKEATQKEAPTSKTETPVRP